MVKNKKMIISEEKIPNTKFKENLIKLGLVEEENISKFNDVKIKDVFNVYEDYKSSKKKCSKKWWFLAFLM